MLTGNKLLFLLLLIHRKTDTHDISLVILLNFNCFFVAEVAVVVL